MADAELLQQDNAPDAGAQPHTPPGPKQVGAIVIGNALEFYDFLTFSFFAVQIGATFFPSSNPTSSLLATLAQDFGVMIASEKFSAVALHSLSMSFTRDPFDRLITAHASLIKAPLITLDSRILDNYLGALG